MKYYIYENKMCALEEEVKKITPMNYLERLVLKEKKIILTQNIISATVIISPLKILIGFLSVSLIFLAIIFDIQNIKIALYVSSSLSAIICLLSMASVKISTHAKLSMAILKTKKPNYEKFLREKYSVN